MKAKFTRTKQLVPPTLSEQLRVSYAIDQKTLDEIVMPPLWQQIGEQAMRLAMTSGHPVNLTYDGRVVCTIRPDGSVKTNDHIEVYHR